MRDYCLPFHDASYQMLCLIECIKALILGNHNEQLRFILSFSMKYQRKKLQIFTLQPFDEKNVQSCPKGLNSRVSLNIYFNLKYIDTYK